MPLIRVEIREGWSHAEKARLLDAIHAAAVETLRIPDEDRTQILTEHPAEAFEIPPGRGDRFTLSSSRCSRVGHLTPSAGSTGPW
jgi:phenylpyruvate tautomerase PptA (4-oxalocrotonate tautomerase family)